MSYLIDIFSYYFTDQKCMDLSNLDEDDQTFIDGNFIFNSYC